jgi:hypothetical protein
MGGGLIRPTLPAYADRPVVDYAGREKYKLGRRECIVREVLKRIAPALRALGFRGSGQNYRKAEGDFVFIINFQGSRSGDTFFVNLGAQPVFIPAEGYADLDKLKEYECVLRRRVGGEWPWDMPNGGAIEPLLADITATQAAFFGHAQTLREAIASGTTERLLREFSAGTTQARAALHLTRAAVALGHPDQARSLAVRGLELAGDAATILRSQLQQVLTS